MHTITVVWLYKTRLQQSNVVLVGCKFTNQGMGRGAGNVTTENLLCEINDIYNLKYNLRPIFNLSQNQFKKLKQNYNWGKSIYYHLSAKHKYPTYIQELLKDDRYDHQNFGNN